MNASKLLPVVVAIVGLLGVAWWVMQPTGTPSDTAGTPGEDLPSVEVAEVRAGPDDDLRRMTATVQPAEDVPLPSPLRGAIQTIEIDDGAQVKDGDVLVRFEQSSQRAELMAAQAERSLLRAELERTRRQADENLAAEEEIEDLELRLEQAMQQLEQARAAVEANNIRAPFSGTASIAGIAPGDIVSRGQTIATLSSDQVDVVRFELPRRLTTDIAVGDDLDVVGADDEATKARIMALGSAPGAEATTVTLTAVLPDADRFSTGDEVTVEVPVTGITTSIVPPAAVLEDARGVRVFRIEQGLARSTPVEKGRATDNGLRVRGPLSPGDVVAVSRLEELQDGMRVAVTDGSGGD